MTEAGPIEHRGVADETLVLLAIELLKFFELLSKYDLYFKQDIICVQNLLRFA
jgi:hypothetical protein